MCNKMPLHIIIIYLMVVFGWLAYLLYLLASSQADLSPAVMC